ncbi:Epidermal retinol dehydrogenase 2 [Frankliniella fusca]|uniref:Short-chain dehydrogenase/reductase 3 n=1 Tax=Frankliniella fusca TaxID=407009 RepID=A0AAE1HNA8_9NEOP|nr:Epidermal retinol dehydrogenase 2 [Frankliniella fusca]
MAHRHATPGALEALAAFARSAQPARLLAVLPRPVVEVLSAAADVILVAVLAVYYVLEAAVFELLPRRFTAKSVDGQVVLVTGAAGGLGRQLALRFARLGATVVAWDINHDGVTETVRRVVSAGGLAFGYSVDLADKQAVYRSAALVKREVGAVDILVNNAGVAFGRTLMQLTDQQIEATYNVNILSHYWTTKAFLPEMMRSNRGHVVTVSSVTGLMGCFRCTDYSATKFATVGFHESLFTELKVLGYDGVHTTLVCPYFIDTGMFAGVKPRLLPMLEPGQAADDIVDAVRTNQVTVTLPGSVRYLLPLKSLFPAKLSWALMYRLMQGPQAMMGMKPRG